MKLHNKTHWRSDQLLKLLSRVAEDELDPEKRKRVVVTVVYGRGVGSSGHATIGGRHMTVRVARDNVDRLAFAKVAAHEMAHLRGLTHRDMGNGARYRWVPGWESFHQYALEYPIERKQTPGAKKKPKADLQEQRYRRVLELQKAWTTKLKRAQTALKKLREKERYYTKALAAKAAADATKFAEGDTE